MSKSRELNDELDEDEVEAEASVLQDAEDESAAGLGGQDEELDEELDEDEDEDEDEAEVEASVL